MRMDEKRLQAELKQRVTKKLAPLFASYPFEPEDIENVLKWKPLVLMLGNYSSGKSTLINELVGQNIQRTGQAPTDDSFTVITATDDQEGARSVPGATVIGDEKLPFVSLKDFGERLIAHFEMKLIDNAPALQNLAIIDSPGMLDSVTEKNRDYDYEGVIGELAKLADLVVLMFDPHKAGTIKETYDAIRTVLPMSAMEDRIIFVMSRIDECDNPGDLVRAYGTLCWNLSQMTGRKDMPRIFLTFSPDLAWESEAHGLGIDERQELKEKIMATPKLRLSHILQDVDRQVQALRLTVEAMAAFSAQGRQLVRQGLTVAAGLGLFLFFFLDMFVRRFAGFPETSFLASLLGGKVPVRLLLIPVAGLILPLLGVVLVLSQWRIPRLAKRHAAASEKLMELDTPYRKNAWLNIQGQVRELIAATRLRDIIFARHRGHLARIDRFLARDMQDYYGKIR